MFQNMILYLRNIPVKDSKDIPDPYVKLKLFSGTNSIRHKTKVRIFKAIARLNLNVFIRIK